MRIVCINRFFWPDHSATSQLLADLAFHLAAQGDVVMVITGRQRYNDALAALVPLELKDNVQIVRVWSTRFGRTWLVGRLLDYLSFYVSAFWALLWHTKSGDVVVSKTDPPMIGVLAAVLACVRPIRRINWLQDVFPEVAQVARIQLSRGMSGSIVRWIRDWSLRSAINVVPGNRMAALLELRGIATVMVLPNWADGASILPLPVSGHPLRKEWGLQGKFVIGYSGNLGRVHDTAAIVAAADVLRDNQEIVFLFVGGGNQSELLKAEAERRRLSNIIFRAYQPREMLGLSLTLPDVHLVSLRPEFEGLVVPSKFYGIAAAGRPCIFIGDSDGEIARLLFEGDCGLTVPDSDGAALAQAIVKLRADQVRCNQMGADARKLFEAEFDMPLALARWRALLKQTVSENR